MCSPTKLVTSCNIVVAQVVHVLPVTRAWQCAWVKSYQLAFYLAKKKRKKKPFTAGIVAGSCEDYFEKPCQTQTPLFTSTRRNEEVTQGKLPQICWAVQFFPAWRASFRCRVTQSCRMCFIKKQCWCTVCSASAVMGNWIYEGLMIEENERFVTDNSKLLCPLTNCALACTRLMNMCSISAGGIPHQPDHEHGYRVTVHHLIWSLAPLLPRSHLNIVKPQLSGV